MIPNRLCKEVSGLLRRNKVYPIQLSNYAKSPVRLCSSCEEISSRAGLHRSRWRERFWRSVWSSGKPKGERAGHETAKEWEVSLKEGKQYLKTDYKVTLTTREDSIQSTWCLSLIQNSVHHYRNANEPTSQKYLPVRINVYDFHLLVSFNLRQFAYKLY